MTSNPAAVPRVGVAPAQALRRRRRLFDVLAEAFRVAFVPVEGETRLALDAVVAFGGRAPTGVPTLHLADGTSRTEGCVRLADTPALDPRLRGRFVGDRRATGPPLPVERGDLVLASSGCQPVWVLRGDGSTRVAATAPEEISGDASLRDQLVDGDFLGLLPLVELLRSVTGAAAWTPPPPRACFVLDDPNLHRPTYGFADFRRLAEDAARHGYHVAIATVPADHWLVSRRAAAIFRAAPELSLALHGNGHLREELARPEPPPRRQALVAQALRRIESLERRAGLHVSRVMVAPHEACSAEMAGTLARSEIEALCNGWGERSSARPLADWEPVDLRAGGLPVLPRRPLHAPRGELVLRAYLDQPLILGLHHGDLADGPGVLAEAAAAVGAIVDARWGPLEEIARAGVATRLDGSTLRVRPYARQFAVDVPSGVESVAVELPPSYASPEREQLLVARDGAAGELALDGRVAAPLPVVAGERVALVLRRVDAFDHRAVRAPLPSPWTLQRRLLAESRDRLAVRRRRPHAARQVR